MAVKKETAPLPWEKYSSIKSYADFVNQFGNGEWGSLSDWKGAPARFFAYIDKYTANWNKFQSPWNPSENPNRTRTTAAEAAAGDVGKAASVLSRNQLTNQIATMNRNLIAARDSQTLYDRAKDKTGLKDYSSTISSLSAQLAKLRADLAKLK